MSAKFPSRDAAKGQPAKLRRIKAPLVLVLPPAVQNVHNPVARAMASRARTGAAGKHIRSQGAQRRADQMALQQATKGYQRGNAPDW